jgi:hypothetical protein
MDDSLNHKIGLKGKKGGLKKTLVWRIQSKLEYVSAESL